MSCPFCGAVNGTPHAVDCQAVKASNNQPDPAVLARPPRGIPPETIWTEACIRQRVGSILDAMQRFTAAGKPVLPEWIDELRRRIL